VLGSLATTFGELIRAPFQNPELVWGIVPLYFGWIVNELRSAKASFGTAIQTGFALLWAVAHWIWQAFRDHPGRLADPSDALPAVNWAVNAVVLVFGAMALWAGLRKRYPRGWKFLGHIRLAGYFMIAIFPIQAGVLHWNWNRLAAVAAFALPVWLTTHLILVPLRRR
jgi:hypothetical protein